MGLLADDDARVVTPDDDQTLDGKRPQGLLVGDLLANRYRLRRYLAAGGMGEVWEAEDVTLQETVALKTVRADRTSPEALLRLQSEVKLARRISHPNVCRVFEFGQHPTADGRVVSFLTMELLRGTSLTDLIEQRGPFPVKEALELLEQLAAALDAAHAAGVVHRDFKGPNIFLEGSRAVVTDFGIARAIDASPRITQDPNALVGTPAYMAPEQVTGGEVGPAADLFALGVVAFELVTGQLPFDGQTPFEVAMARVTNPPRRFAKLAEGVPAHWDDVFAVALARDPRKRFASAAAFIAALKAGAFTPPRPRRFSRVGLGVAAVVLVAGAALAAAWFAGPSSMKWADLSTANATKEEARVAFHRALTAHAARAGDAVGPLKQALERDPGFVEVDLQLGYLETVLGYGSQSDGLTHFRAAMAQRSRLTARDREFLDAIEPGFRDPQDWLESERRLQAFVQQHPRDAPGWEALGSVRDDLGDTLGGALGYRRSREIDPVSTAGLQLDAKLAYLGGDSAGAFRLVDQCLLTSPTQVSCLTSRLALLRLEGRCAELESAAREGFRFRPDAARLLLSYRSYGLAGVHAPPQAFTDLLATMRRAWPPDAQWHIDAWEAQLQRDTQRLVVLREAAREKAGSDDDVTLSASLVADLLELGDTARAGDVAWDGLMSAGAVNQPDSLGTDSTMTLVTALGALGRLSAEEQRAHRARFVDKWRRQLGEAAWKKVAAQAWLVAYGPAPPLELDPALAREAFEAQPLFGGDLSLEPLAWLTMVDGPFLGSLGALQLADGRFGEAEQSLSRALRICGYEVEHPNVRWLRGLARERRGDARGACEDYAVIAREWAERTPQGVTLHQALEHAKTLGCGGR